MVKGWQDRTFLLIAYTLLSGVALMAVFPVMYVVSVSLTPYSEVVRNGGYLVIPKSITFGAYEQLFSMSSIPTGFRVSIFVTVVGTAVNMVLTTLMAFPLSRRRLPGRSGFLLLIIFTMLFSGGLIPTYLVVKETHLLNSLWAMIIPTAIFPFNIFIIKSFFENLPEELMESARIDGTGDWGLLFRIVLPLSMPVILTISLFYAVGHWNDFFSAVLYIQDSTKHPLQLAVRSILMQSGAQQTVVEETLPTATLQMAAVVTASAPMIAIYPFVQRFFTQGMMIGSIKG